MFLLWILSPSLLYLQLQQQLAVLELLDLAFVLQLPLLHLVLLQTADVLH
jgi:hypothetical protein